jgi:hypothetical protein
MPIGYFAGYELIEELGRGDMRLRGDRPSFYLK